jgi:hypothetical protein
MSRGSYDPSLFDVLDNVIAQTKQALQEREWEYTDDSQTEALKLHLDHLYDCKAHGDYLLPRF